MKERIYQRKVFARAFQFDGDANNYIFNADIPKWAINARKIEIIKSVIQELCISTIENIQIL